MVTENPALKLYNLLREALKYKQDLRLSASNPPYREVWARVFDIEERDTSGLLRNTNHLFNLFISTKHYIQNNQRLNTEKNNYYLRIIENELLKIDFQGEVQFKQLNDEVLTALYYISENISLIYSIEENIIDSDELNSLIQEVDNLLDSISNSDLPEDVKKILVKNLHIIRESLYSYKISGIEGVRNALEQSIGSLIINNQIIGTASDNENVTKTFKMIDKLNRFLSTANAAKDFLIPIAKLFIKQ